MDYYFGTKKSFLDLFKNPRIFIPDIAYFVIQLISSSVLFSSDLIKGVFNFNSLEQELKNEIASQLAGNSLLQVIASISIFVIFSFFLSVGIEALKFHMMSRVVIENKCSLRQAWKARWKNYIKLGLLKAMVYIIFAAIAAVIASPLIVLQASKTKYLFLALAIGIALFIRIALLFAYQYLFLKNEGPLQAFGNSILTLKRRPLHSFASWGIITAFGILLAIFTLTLSSNLKWFIMPAIISFIYLIYKTWSEMFLFEMAAAKP